MAEGASWEHGLDGPIRLRALHVLQATSATPNGSRSITDLSPKFLAFYGEAIKEKASPCRARTRSLLCRMASCGRAEKGNRGGVSRAADFRAN
jgi:hypothetical protein